MRDKIVFFGTVYVCSLLAVYEIATERAIENNYCTGLKNPPAISLYDKPIPEFNPRLETKQPPTYCSKWNIAGNQKKCIEWKLRKEWM